MKKYYKVLHKTRGGNLYSCFADTKPWKLKYPEEEWVTPSIGKIFIFDTKVSAINFMLDSRWGNVVYVCYGKIVKTPPSGFANWGRINWNAIWENFRNSKLPKKLDKNDSRLPEHTVFADSIKLIKQVYPKEKEKNET